MNKRMSKLMEQLKPVYGPCVGKGSGTDFDDVQNDKANPDTEAISGIVIRAGDIIDAIGIYYGNPPKTVMHGNYRGGTEIRVAFEKGDSLKSIEGICDVPYAGNKNFSRIKVKTVKGKEYGPYGNAANGIPFKLDIPEGKMFLGFYGKVNESADIVGVNRLGIIYSEGTADMGGILGGLAENQQDNPFGNMFGGMK